MSHAAATAVDDTDESNCAAGVICTAQKNTTVELQFKNIPGGDTFGNTNPKTYPQHAFIVVRDNVTGKETIVRAGPGGQGGNAVFGSIKGIVVPNVANSSPDFGAQVHVGSFYVPTRRSLPFFAVRLCLPPRTFITSFLPSSHVPSLLPFDTVPDD